MKKIIVLAIACTLALTLMACGKSDAIRETERLINEIGTVSVDSEGAVETAEEAYDALSREEQNQIGNYHVLTAARQALDAAKLEAQRQSVLGKWQMELDAKAALVAEIDATFSEVDITFGDYLEHFILVLNMELCEDGTYHEELDTEIVGASIQGLHDALISFIRAYFRQSVAQTLQESGVQGDFDTEAGLEAAIGKTLDAALEDGMGMSPEDYVGILMGEMELDNGFAEYKLDGTFRVEPGRIYFSDAPDREPGEEEYRTYTLVGNTLTLMPDASDALLGETEWIFTRIS